MSKQTVLPAEWQPQDAVMLTWPHKDTDWQPRLEKVEATFVEIAKAISQYQQVIIVCHDQTLKSHVEKLLAQAKVVSSKITYVVTPTNDTWARDHGPITVINKKAKQLTALNFTFNGWGNKYASDKDNVINDNLFAQCGIKNHQTIDFVLEGGGIEIDEQGHLLTTTECLLNHNRNPKLNQSQIEKTLTTHLGCKKFLWLNSGALAGDDTDSHIDTLARFAPNQVIIYQGCQDETDNHYAPLNAMKAELEQFTTVNKEPFILFELPWPDAQYNDDGERLPATYANFLVINNAVLMPTYGVAQDRKAQIVMHMAFPEHEIIPIDCRQIIEQFGSLHCLTMQLPKGILPRN